MDQVDRGPTKAYFEEQITGGNTDELGYLHERIDALCRQVATDLGEIIAHGQGARFANPRAYTKMAQNRLQLAQDAVAEKFGREHRVIFTRRSRGR